MIAIYRVLYGEDYIEPSINSVLPFVTDVFVFWTNRVWGDCKGVDYKGEYIEFPEKFDNVVEVVENMKSNKIHLIENYYPRPHNQFAYLVFEANKYTDVDEVVFMEPDMVITRWPDSKGEAPPMPTATPQIEVWKTEYTIPQRDRPGPIFVKAPVRQTAANGWPIHHPMAWNNGQAVNYGFSISDEVMYWKHLTAMAFSPLVGDSIPNPDWYEDKWLNWTPETQNLEISLGHEHKIPYAR